jgi:hypothetical protein
LNFREIHLRRDAEGSQTEDGRSTREAGMDG